MSQNQQKVLRCSGLSCHWRIPYPISECLPQAADTLYFQPNLLIISLGGNRCCSSWFVSCHPHGNPDGIPKSQICPYLSLLHLGNKQGDGKSLFPYSPHYRSVFQINTWLLGKNDKDLRSRGMNHCVCPGCVGWRMWCCDVQGQEERYLPAQGEKHCLSLHWVRSNYIRDDGSFLFSLLIQILIWQKQLTKQREGRGGGRVGERKQREKKGGSRKDKQGY